MTGTIEIVPLGGLGEFGMNCMAIRYDGRILVVDAGLMFPREDPFGVDLVIPDFSYLIEHREEIQAIVLTHGHEDHTGALPYLLQEVNVPVYGTALTLGLIRGRLSEHGMLDSARLHTIRARDQLELGGMELEFLAVTHSIADSVGLAITTPVGTVVHTGDFKFDQSPPDRKTADYGRFGYHGERGVLALLSDSTNSERPGYTPSESYVRRQLEQIFLTSAGKIVLACFASSIHRIQLVLELAQQSGRRVLVLGRSMIQNIAIAGELGFLQVPPGLTLPLEEARKIAPERLVILSTGSQGEPMSALARLALDKQTGLRIVPGDSVIISARAIPGNQNRISHLINHFCRRGANVYDEGQWGVHVSGHGSQEELKLMLNLTRPRYLIPIHGEYRQLYHHGLLAHAVGIPPERVVLAETGDIVSISQQECKLRGKAPVGRRFLDDGGFADLDELVVADRRHLSREGVVLAVVLINQATGEIEGQPELVSRGHLQDQDSTAILSRARTLILQTLQESSSEERSDALVLTELLRRDLKRFFRKQVGTRPMIIPLVLEI